MSLVLDVHFPDRRIRVAFSGPDAETHALGYLLPRLDRITFSENASAPIDDQTYPRIFDLLHPEGTP